MSGRVMVDSHIRHLTASLTDQSPSGSSSCFGPRSAPGEAELSEMDYTSNRFIKLSTYASCDNLIVPSSTYLSMPHPSYHVHSPKLFVGNFLFRDASNESWRGPMVPGDFLPLLPRFRLPLLPLAPCALRVGRAPPPSCQGRTRCPSLPPSLRLDLTHSPRSRPPPL